MFMYYTVCYFTGIVYPVVRQISMLFMGNKDSVFCLKKYIKITMTMSDQKQVHVTC